MRIWHRRCTSTLIVSYQWETTSAEICRTTAAGSPSHPERHTQPHKRSSQLPIRAAIRLVFRLLGTVRRRSARNKWRRWTGRKQTCAGHCLCCVMRPSGCSPWRKPFYMVVSGSIFKPAGPARVSPSIITATLMARQWHRIGHPSIYLAIRPSILQFILPSSLASFLQFLFFAR